MSSVKSVPKSNRESAEIIHALYEPVVTSRRHVSSDLQMAIENRTPGEPVWISIIRFLVKHVSEIIDTALLEQSIECRGWVVVCREGTSNIQSFGKTPSEDSLLPKVWQEWEKFLYREGPYFGNIVSALSIAEDGRPFPLAVQIHPILNNNMPVLVYLLAPTSQHPIYSASPSYMGAVIWTSAQQVLFNSTTLTYLRRLEQQFSDAVAREDIVRIGEYIENLLPMYYVIQEPAVAGDQKVDPCDIGKKAQQSSYSQFRSTLVSFAFKFSLGREWHKLPFLTKGEERVRFASRIEESNLLSEDDLEVLRLTRIAVGEQLGEDEDTSILTKWLDTLFRVRELKFCWGSDETAQQRRKWEYVAERLSNICHGAAKELEKVLFRGEAAKYWVDIDDDWTRAYLALLVMRAFKQKRASKLRLEFSPLGLDLAEHLARVVLVALGQHLIPLGDKADIWYDPVSYTESLINIIAWYTHEVIGVEVDLPIADTLRRVYESEASLYSLKPYYRDHLYHVIDVCMLGHLLMGEDLGHAFKAGKTEEEIRTALKQWYVAAIFHDVGYVAELLSSSLRLLKDVHSPEVQEFYDSLQDNYRSAEKQYCNRIYNEVDKNHQPCIRDGLDHGTTSAAHLLFLLNGVAGGAELYRPAIDAIIAHNLHPTYPIEQTKAPVSALLALCDELQEWGRASVEAPEFLRHIAATRNLGDYPLRRFHPLDTLTIKKSTDGKLRFTLNYRSPDEGLFDTARLWLNKTSNFERVEWDQTIGVWDVEVRVPISVKYQGLGLYEMDLMQKCAWEDINLLPLRRWVRLAKEQQWYRKDGDVEVLCFPLNLNKLPRSFLPVTREALDALGRYHALRTGEVSVISERIWAMRTWK